MSLATRCTACGTIFRIVEDQLRVSDGWVRCGRCAEIFDARELLFDIEQEAPPPWPAAFASEPVVEPPPPPPPPPPAPPPPPEPVWMPPPEPEPHTEALPTGWPSEVARHEPRWVDADEPVVTPLPPPAREPDSPPPLAAEPSAAPPAVVPEFMRRAESTARWNHPRARAALGAASVLLAALLALQITLHFRDTLAALHPPLRAGLQGLCGVIGCEVSPLRHIEALRIEWHSLNPMGAGSYKLQLSLRNKTAVDVAAPWVELSLTDASGVPFTRRVIGPDAFTPQVRQVDAGAEQALSFSFSTGNQRVSGYSVDIFHP